LKVVYYTFFYGRSILVVLCRAAALPGPGGEAPPKKYFAFLTKSGHLAFKIVIKKNTKIKPQTAINRHHAFVAVCFKILK